MIEDLIFIKPLPHRGTLDFKLLGLTPKESFDLIENHFRSRNLKTREYKVKNEKLEKISVTWISPIMNNEDCEIELWISDSLFSDMIDIHEYFTVKNNSKFTGKFNSLKFNL